MQEVSSVGLSPSFFNLKGEIASETGGGGGVCEEEGVGRESVGGVRHSHASLGLNSLTDRLEKISSSIQ